MAQGLLTKPLPAESEWLRASANGRNGEVNRDKGIVYGVILAEEGPFKSQGRGEFDRAAIRSIVKMTNEKPTGLKSRWTHPNMSNDGLGRLLGRMKNARTDTVLREAGKDASGKGLMKEMLVARADLHLDPTALEEPVGGGKPMGVYIMDLADSDPDAFGTSLVLQANQEMRLDAKGKPLKDASGEDLPPIWIPTRLHSSDAVDDGDATHSFLSADMLASLPDAIVRQGCELLDAQFAGQPRNVVEARLGAFVGRYLSYRFGEELAAEEPAGEPETPASEPSDDADKLDLELSLMEAGDG